MSTIYFENCIPYHLHAKTRHARLGCFAFLPVLLRLGAVSSSIKAQERDPATHDVPVIASTTIERSKPNIETKRREL